MKDTKKILRSAIYTALNGNVSYNAVNVPVYDERVPSTTTSNLFIAFSTQQEQDVEEQDSTWVTDSFIDFDIVNKTASEVSKDINDDVYEDVLEILFPTRLTIGITVPSGFQFLAGRRISSITQNVTLSPTESILVTTVKLVFRIVQK